jgi:hypothetical protein
VGFSVKELVIWTIPLGIAGVAAVLGVRAYREKPWEAPPIPSALPPQCPDGVYRCRDRELQVSTGDLGPDGKTCGFKRLSNCTRACSTTQAVLAGVDDDTAKKQLCDPPRKIGTLVSEERSFLSAPVADAEVCEGDGYIPTETGFDQCILKSSNDPAASGIVTGRVRCRFGAVATTERAPRLIKREEAIALWCKREPGWSPALDVEDDGGVSDATTDAASDGASDGASDAPGG